MINKNYYLKKFAFADKEKVIDLTRRALLASGVMSDDEVNAGVREELAKLKAKKKKSDIYKQLGIDPNRPVTKIDDQFIEDMWKAMKAKGQI